MSHIQISCFMNLAYLFFEFLQDPHHSGKSATNRESNHGSGVCKEHYALYYVPKHSILLAGTGVWKISSVACGFSFIKIDHSDYPKSIISRINEVLFFEKKTLHLSNLFCCNRTCYCANMVSVTSIACYITSASCYHLRYQSRSLMYIRGLIPRNFAELAEAVPIGSGLAL